MMIQCVATTIISIIRSTDTCPDPNLNPKSYTPKGLFKHGLPKSDAEASGGGGGGATQDPELAKL